MLAIDPQLSFYAAWNPFPLPSPSPSGYDRVMPKRPTIRTIGAVIAKIGGVGISILWWATVLALTPIPFLIIKPAAALPQEVWIALSSIVAALFIWYVVRMTNKIRHDNRHSDAP
jgi:hypothetical protein